MISQIITITLLIWAFTRADYNQCKIGADDIRASDEGTGWSADQAIDRLGGREGAVFVDGDSGYVFRCTVWARRTGQDGTGNDGRRQEPKGNM